MSDMNRAFESDVKAKEFEQKKRNFLINSSNIDLVPTAADFSHLIDAFGRLLVDDYDGLESLDIRIPEY